MSVIFRTLTSPAEFLMMESASSHPRTREFNSARGMVWPLEFDREPTAGTLMGSYRSEPLPARNWPLPVNATAARANLDASTVIIR